METRPLAHSLIVSPTPARVGRIAVAQQSLASLRGGEDHSTQTGPRSRRIARFAATELGIWAALYGVYLAVRGITLGSKDTAVSHAWDVVSLERSVGLFHESGIQSVFHAVAGFFSAYYMLGFAPLLGVVLVWLALRHPQSYRELRTTLFVSLAFATVVFVLFPTAPPRLVDGLGVADTVGLSSHDTGSFLGIRFNPYAAVPSMHVGWSLLVGLCGFRAASSRAVRVFFLAHPAVMAVTVTATGNHFLFDAIAGIAVACLTLLLLRFRPRRSAPFPPLRLVSSASPASPYRHVIELERKAA